MSAKEQSELTAAQLRLLLAPLLVASNEPARKSTMTDEDRKAFAEMRARELAERQAARDKRRKAAK